MTSFQEINSTYQIDMDQIYKSIMIPKTHNPKIFCLFVCLNGVVQATTYMIYTLYIWTFNTLFIEIESLTYRKKVYFEGLMQKLIRFPKKALSTTLYPA